MPIGEEIGDAAFLPGNFFMLSPVDMFQYLVTSNPYMPDSNDFLLELISYIPTTVSYVEIHSTASLEVEYAVLGSGIQVPSLNIVSSLYFILVPGVVM